MAKKKKIEEEKKEEKKETKEEVATEKKETKKEVATEKKKFEKRVTKKQPKTNIRLYSLEELSDLLGISVPQMRSLYLRRGLDRKEKLSLREAYEKFNTIA